jgi:1-acyl-sn-glycerol-3-phosphate acyltransferase
MKISKIYPGFLWLIYFLYAGIFMILIPSSLKLLKNYTWSENYFIFSFFGEISCKLFGIKVKYQHLGSEQLTKQYLIAANHRSWFDQISMMGHLPIKTHFLSKAAYFKIPFLKYAFKNYEVISVDRKALAPKARTTLESYIERGDSVTYFIEGTRGEGRSLLPFKNGVFSMAAKTGLPVLPTYILGSEECLSKKNPLLSIKGGDLVIITGNPVYFSIDNIDIQIKEFEKKYTEVHNSLYDEFENYKQEKSKNYIFASTQFI